MRTKDELFREALRHIAARRQQAVTAAERDRAAALAAHPELRAAEDAVTTARHNLFSAYNSYLWAVEYGILN